MIPAEHKAESLRATSEPNIEDRRISLDLLEEHRVQAIEKMAKYTEGVARAYNRKVKARPLSPGDMVLKRIPNPATVGKLETKWEGPFVITRATRAGTFYLATIEGHQLGHTWNAKSLRKFYP